MPFPGVPGQIPASLPGMFAGAGMAAIPGYPVVPGMMGGMVGGMVGPPQATAGRSLRSYEDLDAAGGEEKVVAELDY